MMLAAVAATPCPNASQVDYVDAHTLKLVGNHFAHDPVKTHQYHRLPASAEGVVRSSIWSLSLQTAGFAVVFETSSDVSQIFVDYNLTSSTLGFVHMSPTGVSGADLWAQDPASGMWRWVNTTQPQDLRVCQELVSLQPPNTPGAKYPTRWMLYFPLYNGVHGLRIGVPHGATPLTPCTGDCGLGLTEKPVVWYGSSITQGACASKPGDAYTNAIGRELRRPIANFGFSGNCFFEPDVVDFLLSIDAAAYVVDCDPNSDSMGADFVYNQSLALGRHMLSKRPDATVIFASGTKEGAVWLEGSDNQHTQGNAAIHKAYAEMAAQFPAAALHFVDGDQIYSQPDPHVFWEMTVMGTHPSSLGMQRFTSFWAPLLQKFITKA